jgi:uncharacterized membrane protein YqjE
VLKDSILKFLKLESLIENLTGYVETRIELTKMEIREDLAKGLSNFLLFILLGVVFTLFVILISIAVAHLIAKSIGPVAGFAIVAGFYLLLGLLVFAFRGAIVEKLQKQLIQIMKKKKE